MSDQCSNPIGGFTAAWEIVPDQFDYFTNIANGYIQAANTFTQTLADYDIAPVNIDTVAWNTDYQYSPFEKPADPGDFSTPDRLFNAPAPGVPTINSVDVSGLNVPTDFGSAPDAPNITIPSAPIVTLPAVPASPEITPVEVPTYVGEPLPEVPTLYALSLPDAPEVDVESLVIERPSFIPPGALQDSYYQDLNSFRDVIWTGVDSELTAAGIPAVNTRLNTMLAGGTGLPANIEQALFDRAIGRDEVSSVQAVQQAHTEWGARGFDLPGSTLLARTQEVRQANRSERGRINREISIQFHNQEIENLRFSVQQGVALEGTLLEAHTRIYDSARQLADGHWVVAKGIYDSALDIFRLQLEVYRSDIEAFKEKLQIELVKLEVYRSELESQRVIGQLNQQLVDIYNAELQGVLAGVEVFRAQVGAATAQIEAEKSKIDIFNSQIEAYTATLTGERIKFEVYEQQISAEESRAKVYNSQVDAYATRIEGYRAQVGAEVSKVDALTKVEEGRAQVYSDQVRAWGSGVAADVQNIEALAQVYNTQIAKYTALLGAEEARVTGESRNFSIAVEEERTRVEALIQQTNQSIEQMKHVTALGLSATETAATVNSQLAASSMSAISVGATMQSSNTVSASDDRSCRTSYSGVVL